MKILWLTNIPLPEACQLLNDKPSPFGGWLVNSSLDLSKREEIELHIAFPYDKIIDLREVKGKNISYYAFPPLTNWDIRKPGRLLKIGSLLSKIEPDLVHIFGTEFAHSNIMVRLCNETGLKSVVSIQGLTSIYSQHYMASLPLKVQLLFTIRDLIKRENLLVQQNVYKKRGKIEIETLKNTKNVIGRTTWDKACTTKINPDVNYHFCNETLRGVFYKHTWNLEDCEKYSIFTSQAHFPIKGVHFVLKAMPLILKEFPMTKLYIAGYDITRIDSIKQKIRISSYAKYLRELISEYNLNDNVEFTGVLDEEQMCQRYLKSHVFICPSVVENSPNSLGEAMLLGVPCIASDVGGVTDMLIHKEEGYIYPADAPYLLAYYVCDIFENNNTARKLSHNARLKANSTHNIIKNTDQLLEIYDAILEEGI